MTVVLRGLLVLWWLVASPAAWANTYRFGLFVGNNEGLPGDVPLLFAESDAEKMRELFVQWGGIESRDATLLLGATARGLYTELERLQGRVQELVRQGHEVSVVFYYSGHADDDALHLSASKLEYVNLRHRLEATGAQVRVALVDACQSGGLVRQKGGVRGPTMAFERPTVESMRGTAIITSSAASELSQESRELGGGFFTHYLHTALSGAADRDRDGEVSLAEAYDYVFVETAFRTREAPEAQTPLGDFDLAGSGPVVLTRLEEATARLSFLGDLEGTYSVWDESRKRYVAEVDGTRTLTLSLRPGTFYVHKRMPGWVEEASYPVRRGETRTVVVEDFAVVSYESAASRGDLERQIRRVQLPDLSLRFLAGFRSVGNQGYGADYFAPLGVGGFEARWLGRGTTYWAADVLAGRGAVELSFPNLAPVQAITGSTSLHGTAGIATRPATVRAGVGIRAGATWLSREFPDWSVEPQTTLTPSAGSQTWVGIHRGRFAADLQWNFQMLVTTWDGQRGWPVYSDVLLGLGYRF